MRTFIVPHRAQRDAWASRHDLDCCSGLITRPGRSSASSVSEGNQTPRGNEPNGLWDELPECSGSAHRLIVPLVAYC